MRKRITAEEASNLDRDEFVTRFGSLFESSPHFAEAAWRKRPVRDFSHLFRTFREAVYETSSERQIALIRAHPDLAGKAAVEGALTQESTREQASAGLDKLSPEEYKSFTCMNSAYKEKFGFPMVVCVREHTKESILKQVEARLKHSRDEEVETALAEISKIARLRMQDIVEPESYENDGVTSAKDTVG